MDGKVLRRTWPTASFSLTVELIEWLESEAKRRSDAEECNVSKSIIVREALTEKKEAQEREAA